MSVLIKGLNIKPCKDGFDGTGLVIIGYDDKLYAVSHKQIIPLSENGDLIGVVRCRDCKHRPTMPENSRGVFDLEFPDNECPCQCGDPWYNREPEGDWFCANGERSEDGGEEQ